jgi:putative colanic acid biosynthesis UDP-glucose lipid carrier transferase
LKPERVRLYFSGYFSDISNLEVTGGIKDIKSFVIENAIDEVYCSLDEVSNEQLKELIEFADENNKTIKFIPDTKEILTKNLKLIITIFFPVLSLHKTVLDEPLVKFFKRTFDIFPCSNYRNFILADADLGYFN